jgi:hypothetical protein
MIPNIFRDWLGGFCINLLGLISWNNYTGDALAGKFFERSKKRQDQDILNLMRNAGNIKNELLNLSRNASRVCLRVPLSVIISGLIGVSRGITK